jgi:hypothetical protein
MWGETQGMSFYRGRKGTSGDELREHVLSKAFHITIEVESEKVTYCPEGGLLEMIIELRTMAGLTFMEQEI